MRGIKAACSCLPFLVALKAWCKFLCILGEAKLLSDTEHKIFTGFHPEILCVIVHNHIKKCFALQGNLMISSEVVHF